MSEKVSHTSEPWDIGPDGDFWNADGPIALFSGKLSLRMANIERIKACVNACKGIELQTLEAAASRGGIGALKVLADNLEFRQQRDQLAEALKYWMPDESNVLAEGSVPGAGSVRAKFYEHIALLSSLKEQ